MNSFFQRLIQRKFWQHVATLSSGSIAAQLISVITLPVLSRLYLPEAYGVFGIFIAVVALMVVVVNGGYELAIMLPESHEESDHLVIISLRLATLISLLLLVLLVLLGPSLLTYMHVDKLVGWHLMIAVSLWLEGLAQPLSFALNRYQRYRILALSRLFRVILTTVVSLWLGWLDWGFSGLILGYISGQAVYLMWMGMSYFRIRNAFFPQPGQRNEKAIGDYTDFPRYAVLSAWLNTASKQLPFFFLPRMYGAQVNGWFTKADKILNIPPAFIGMAIGRVYFQQASQSWHSGSEKLTEITRQTFLRLVFLGLPFLVVVTIWGPELFAWVLGEAWREAGLYARWLVPWLYLAFVVSPLSFLIDIRRKLKEFLYYNLVLFIVRLLALLIGSIYFDAVGCMIIYGASGVLMLGLQLMYLLWLGRVVKFKVIKKY